MATRSNGLDGQSHYFRDLSGNSAHAYACRMIRRCVGLFSIFLFLNAASLAFAAKPRTHSVTLGGVRVVPYSVEGDPSGALPDETRLRVRPLVIDSRVKEWTTGEVHDVTDRSFAVRRAIRLNDSLPTDRTDHWVWQRGPWLLIDRASGKITALHLPDYDPAVSDVVWFRDLAAYCGLNAGGKQLYAVVAQLAVRKPVLSRRLGEWNPAAHSTPACAPAVWQREPLQVSFSPTGASAISFNLIGSSAVLVEDGDAPETPSDTASGSPSN